MQLIPDVILLEHQKIENVNVAHHDASTSTAHQVYAQTPPYMLSYGLISSFLNNFFFFTFGCGTVHQLILKVFLLNQHLKNAERK